MDKDKNENYYGSPLNKFIDEKCSHEMTCINIDCLLLKRSQKKIRVIESKHSKEELQRAQHEALSRLHELLEIGQKDNSWSAEVYIVKGDPPYDYADIDPYSSQWVEKDVHRLSQENLIKWLGFENELHELPNERLIKDDSPQEPPSIRFSANQNRGFHAR